MEYERLAGANSVKFRSSVGQEAETLSWVCTIIMFYSVTKKIAATMRFWFSD